jgi:hypothetical protein
MPRLDATFSLSVMVLRVVLPTLLGINVGLTIEPLAQPTVTRHPGRESAARVGRDDEFEGIAPYDYSRITTYPLRFT